MEWLNLMVRWVHVVAGIMWIGASFYFIFLENNLNRTHNVREELAGNLWAIHGGGFYFLEKYKVAPQIIPRDLHWFKYEAYFTWLTGAGLLFIVYYMDAKSFLIDKSVADISSGTGIAIGIGTLVLGWILYDRMCKSPLIAKPKLFAIVGLIILTVISYFLAHVFNPRAAFIHVGALLGTIMAANVFFVIIPSQKALVKAAVTGMPLDASLGKKAGQRSLHNNYTTLPVIFIMISNHFPSTFGNEFNWIVLMVMTVASAGIKHYWNLVERGIVKRYILIVSVLMLLLLALFTSPAFEKTTEASPPVPFTEVNAIFQQRCVQCHSSAPTDDQWTSAPNGVMYDTPEQIQSMTDKILIRAVDTKTMPQGNKTGMTDEERMVLKRWIQQGAKIPH
ncbi:MAG: urate hydroxylase PuuD [Crocinitomicaceae bacterium]|nr:urate hydroxylase PuuD [Crocinitomicaceae bacterium]